MKTVCIIILCMAALAAGCTGTAPAAVPAATPAAPAAIPDLTGSWTGPMQGYDQGTGMSDYTGLKALMNVTEQHGRIFAGQFVFIANGTTTTSGFAGVIGQDGRTFSLAEEAGGYCTGTLTDDGGMEMTYLEDGSPYSAAIDTFRRVGK